MTAITQALNLSTHHVSTQQSLTQLGLLCALLAHIDSFKVFTHMPLHMPPKSLIKFQTMLSQQFNANHTPSHYAQALNISTGQLTRICKEFTGKPTRVLIQERLLLEALRELIYTHDTIGSIAKKLGFKDENYFGRFFRKHTSYSPSQYRFKHWQKL